MYISEGSERNDTKGGSPRNWLQEGKPVYVSEATFRQFSLLADFHCQNYDHNKNKMVMSERHR